MLQSTRWSIVEKALADVFERLAELPMTAEVQDLRAKALLYETAIKRWPTVMPSEIQRAAITRGVLDLNVEVMGVARAMRTV